MSEQTAHSNQQSTNVPETTTQVGGGGGMGEYVSPTGLSMPMNVALDNPATLDPDNIQRLQSTLGNQFVMRMVNNGASSRQGNSTLKGFSRNTLQRDIKIQSANRYGKIQRDDLPEGNVVKQQIEEVDDVGDDIQDDVSDEPSPEIMTGDDYHRDTKVSRFKGKRGKTAKKIEEILNHYHTTRNIEDKLIAGEEAMGMNLKSIQETIYGHLQELGALVDIWLTRHDGERALKSKRKRYATVAALKAQLIIKTDEYKTKTVATKTEVIKDLMQGAINSDTQDVQSYKQMTPEEKEVFAQQSAKEQADPEKNFRVKEIKEEYEGSASNFFNKFLKHIFDVVLPGVGEGKAEIQFRFPVDPSGTAYVGGRFYTKVERYSSDPTKADAVKAEGEMVIQVGGGIGNVVDLNGELGGFKEAKASSTAEVAQLFSYSSYRRWRESSLVPREIVNLLWGGSGGLVGYNAAEAWASGVEEDIFGDDVKDAKKKYVIDAFTANLNLKAGGMIGFSEKFRAGKRYTKATMGDRLGKKKKFTGKRGGDKSKGQDILYNAIKFSVSTTFGGGEFEMKNQWRDVETIGAKAKKKLTKKSEPDKEPDVDPSVIEQIVDDVVEMDESELDDGIEMGLQVINDLDNGDENGDKEEENVEEVKEEKAPKPHPLTGFMGADFTAMKGTFYLKVPFHKAAGPAQGAMIAGIITESLDSIKTLYEKYFGETEEYFKKQIDEATEAGDTDKVEALKKQQEKAQARKDEQKNAALAHSLGSALADSAGLATQIHANLDTASVAWKNLDELKSQIGGSTGLQLQIAYENEDNKGKWKVRLNHDQQIKAQAMAGAVKVFAAKFQQDTNIFSYEYKLGEGGSFTHLNAALSMVKFVGEKGVELGGKVKDKLSSD